MTEQKAKKAQLVKLLIKSGWNPPRPSDRIVRAIAEDIERVTESGVTLELTHQQRACISAAAAGLSRIETAKSLGIKPETVKEHLTSAYRRLGAKNQAHAVAIAIRQGIISVDEEAVAA